MRVQKPALVALCALVLVSGFASASGPSSAATPGLVLALGFDEGSGTSATDASGSGNNGTTANTTWVMGKYGGALSFNGSSSRVTIPDTPSLHLTTAMTLEAWVEKTATNANWRDVIYKGNDNYYLSSSSQPGNRPAGGAIIGGAYAEAYATASLATNTWAHLAVTYDGSAVRMYVNGIQVGSAAKTGSITTSSNPLTIGSDSFYGQYFQGLIDEVRVYNVALSAAQIQTDMNAPINPPAADTTPPSAPGTLTATASGSAQVNLSWGAATDNVGVSGYRIERCQGSGCSNFTQIAAPTGTGTTYSDTGLSASTSYTYRVRASDAAGNLGAYTNTANATTQAAADTTPPSAPGTLTATASGSAQVNLSWGAATDNVGVSGYRIERCQGSGCSNFTQIAAPTGTGTTYSDTGLSASTSYTYRVRASDAAGNLGAYTNTANATTQAAADTTPPSAPGTLTATASGSAQVNLSWGAATDNVGVSGYRIERCQGSGCSNFTQIAAPTGTGTTYSDTGLSASTSYTYRVRASDAAGNLGAYTNTANATTQAAADTTPPSAPGTLTATASGSAQVNLSWGAAADNVGVSGYRIERCQGSGCSNFTQIAAPTGTGTTYSDTGLSASTSYTYRVRASDAAGNLGAYTNTANATTQPAAMPILVAAYAFDEGAGASVVDASGNGNNGTLANATWATNGRYGNALVFNGTNATVNIPNSGSLQLTSGMTLEAWVNPTTVTSTWRDVIYKGNDNYYLSGTSTIGSRPAGGGTFAGANTNAYGTTALTPSAWSHLALTYDGAALRLYVNGALVGSQAKTGAISVSNNGLQIGGDSLYGQYFNGMIDEVRVYNGPLSTAAIQADMNTPIGGGSSDVQPPSAPGVLSASAVSSSEIDLAWGPATDNVGVTGYQILRCQGALCTNFSQVAQVAGSASSYSDTTLAAGTSYGYEVRALDAAGNVGPFSNAAAATTSLNTDNTPPSAPGTVTATAAASAINLSWGAATDNVGVAGYQVERCQGGGCSAFAQIGTVSGTGTTYSDTGLSASTSYSYRVRAVDAAGNLGPYSNTATATTPAAFSDDFNRADGSLGANWTDTSDGGLSISSQTIVGTSATAGDIRTSETYGSDQYSQIEVTSTQLSGGQWVGPAVRTQNGGQDTYLGIYFWNSGTPQLRLYKRSAGTWIQLGNSYNSGPLPAGTKLKLVTTGSTLSFQQDGVERIAVSDTSLTGGAPGIMTFGAAHGDNWTGGNTTSSDVQPPSAPGVLSASAVSSSEIDLAWGPATDNVGVTGYQILRCQGALCTNFSQVAQVAGSASSYSDTTLAAGTSYGYEVRALDAAGNVGPFSNAAAATTSLNTDNTPPSAPGTVTATAAASAINLSWGAATDNVGVAGYQVERCQGGGCSAFAQIGTVSGTGTTYSDTGLSASTSYSYRVRAVDAAGNLGPYSNTATATTPAAFSDDFNRADGSLGANWTDTSDGGLSISSQTIVGTSATAGDIRTSETYGSDQYSQIEVTSTQLSGGQWVGPAVRTQNGGQDTYLGIYFWNSGTPQLRLYKRSAGTWIQLGNSYNSGPLPAGTKLKLVTTGSTLSFQQDGVERIAVSDTSLTGGAPGIMTFGAAHGDNWTGGNATASAAPPFQVVYRSTDANGVASYDVTSVDNAPGVQTLRILAPTNPAPGVSHNFLYLLPVEAGLGTQYGDGIDTLRSLNAQNQYNLTIVEPSFGIEPWYADNSIDSDLHYDSFMANDLVPWVTQNLSLTGQEQNWLMGFSKSGIGGQDLLLKHPNVFSLVASWDFPADMSTYDQFGGSADNYGTNANFQTNYRLTQTFVDAHKAPFLANNRIWIGGYWTFRTDMADYESLLTAEGIAHTTETPQQMLHRWDSGWVPVALAALRQDSINLSLTP